MIAASCDNCVSLCVSLSPGGLCDQSELYAQIDLYENSAVPCYGIQLENEAAPVRLPQTKTHRHLLLYYRRERYFFLSSFICMSCCHGVLFFCQVAWKEHGNTISPWVKESSLGELSSAR